MFNQEITWLSLGLASLILLLPIFIFQYFKTGLVKPTVYAFLRMGGQLTLVGLYLKFIFKWNNPWINLLWIVIMIAVASLMVTSRSDIRKKYFALPVALSIVVNVIINGAIFGFIILSPNNILDARYLIPLMGMVIGNTLNSTIIGIRTFFKSLIKEEDRYKFYIMSGATRKEALFPFVSESLKEAFNPVIASTAAIGLIWLPGMMAGQILGGQDPLIAIKYQILIVISIFVGSVVTMFVSVYLAQGFSFDEYEIFNKKVIKSERMLKSKKKIK